LQIDVEDKRFSALYSSHLYNIDPSSQEYRKTKAMQSLVDEKQRLVANKQQRFVKTDKQSVDSVPTSPHPDSRRAGNSFSNMVKAVKANTKLHSQKHSTKPTAFKYTTSKGS